MTFRPFTEYGASARNYITLRTNGSLFVSRKILSDVNMTFDGCNFFTTYIDEKSKKIALIFHNSKRAESYRKVQKVHKKSLSKNGVIVSIHSILKFLEINLPSKKVFIEFETKEDMLIFSIPVY